MINLALKGYKNDRITIFNVENSSHINILKETFTFFEIDKVVSGRTIRNLTRMDCLNANEYLIVEDCLNNNGKNVKAEKVVSENNNYTIYNCGKLTVRIKK